MSVKDSENSPLLPSTPLDPSTREPDTDPIDPESPIDNPNKKCNLLIIILSLLVVIMIMMVIVIVLLLMGTQKVDELGDKVQSSNVAARNGSDTSPCETPQCVALSAQLLNWRNLKIEACDDFYEAACGKYQEHSATDGTRAWEKESIVRRLIHDNISKNSSTTSKSENTLKLLHEKCDEIENRPNSKAAMAKVYEEVLLDIAKIGRWPILEKNWTWDEDYSLNTVNNMMLTLSKFGVYHFGLFEIDVLEFPKNGTRKQLFIRPEYPKAAKNPVHPVDLKNTLEQILIRNKISYERDDLDKDINDYVDFMKSMEDYFNSTGLLAEFDELLQERPEIPFEALIQNLINPVNGKWDELRPRVSTAGFLLFFSQSDNIMNIINKTEPRVLTNLMIFKFVENMFYPMITRKSYEKRKEEKACVDLIVTVLPRAALRVYVRNYFPKRNLQLASEMVKTLKKSYHEIIRASTWLNNATKENAIKKVDQMREIIGYTPEYEKPGALDEMFETLHVSSADTFYSLMMKIQRFKTEQLMDFVTSNSMLNPTEPLVTANAYYFPLKNMLNILVPFLDNPLLDVNFPKYATISGTGRVLAHEIGHAFDYAGRWTDEMGHMHKGLWFQGGMDKAYHERVKCLVEQYQTLEPESAKSIDFYEKAYLFLNGTQLISEMIADALGTQAQWQAYKTMDMAGEQHISGLQNVSYDQMFFYIGALDFCSPNDSKRYSESIPMSHPPNRFRINGVYANMPGFAEAFKCPRGSAMNPERKCQFF